MPNPSLRPSVEPTPKSGLDLNLKPYFIRVRLDSAAAQAYVTVAATLIDWCWAIGKNKFKLWGEKSEVAG
jgi:hypothetical protein